MNKQIRTILCDHAGKFDDEVNLAFKGGWDIFKVTCIGTQFVAFMVKNKESGLTKDEGII